MTEASTGGRRGVFGNGGQKNRGARKREDGPERWGQIVELRGGGGGFFGRGGRVNGKFRGRWKGQEVDRGEPE